MFSFVKKYTESLNGVDIYGDVALVVFTGLFVLMILFAIRAKESYITELEQIPLKD